MDLTIPDWASGCMELRSLNVLADVVASPGSWETTALILVDFIEGFQRTQVKAAAGP